VAFYEMATCNQMFVIQLDQPSAGQAWQALYAASGYEPSMGKFIVAVDEDIDPADPEMLIWSLAFRVQPRRDVRILDNKLPRLDPSADDVSQEPGAIGSALLIDATRPRPYPPTSLPTAPHMQRAEELWEELGLPQLALKAPTAGYELGDWTDENREEARLAELGRYLETGAKLAQEQTRE
jgi:3-polyprenyl-4-hydroxybenzoate decarboxylase